MNSVAVPRPKRTLCRKTNMPSKEEKRRRAKLVEAIVEKDTEEAIAKMPISFQDLGALFDHLDDKLGSAVCDHTAKITKEFLMGRKLDYQTILPWFREQGGYCDCEILANVEEGWEDIIKKNI